MKRSIQSWVFGKVEVLITLVIVAKNNNCQAYLCVFSVFPSYPLSLIILIMAYLVFNSTASFRSVRAPSMGRVFGAHTDRNKAVLLKTRNGVMRMMRKANASTLKMENRRDNGEDGKTENPQR